MVVEEDALTSETASPARNPGAQFWALTHSLTTLHGLFTITTDEYIPARLRLDNLGEECERA